MLEAVRQKPGMYIGGRSVEKLHIMLLGFWFAEDHYDIPAAERLGGFDFNAFEEWIAPRYNPDRLSVRSYWLARVAAGSDDAGFDLWFEWYDAYRGGIPGADQTVG